MRETHAIDKFFPEINNLKYIYVFISQNSILPYLIDEFNLIMNVLLIDQTRKKEQDA